MSGNIMDKIGNLFGLSPLRTRVAHSSVHRRKKRRGRERRLAYESLENRQLLSVTAVLSGSTLKLIGDQANDWISVEISGSQVWFNGTGRTAQSLSASQVGAIDIAGRGGNDTISVSQKSPFPKPIQVFAEDGDDRTTIDVRSDGSARYSVDGGNGRDSLSIPSWMPVGPAGFPQSVWTNSESVFKSTTAWAQGILRGYSQMTSIHRGQIRNPPITSDPASRSAATYQLAIEQFEVGYYSHRRYQWDSDGPKCNVFAGDVMRAMGVPFPTKNELPGNYGTGDLTIGASRLNTWLKEPAEGAVRGWRKIDVNNQSDLDWLLDQVRRGNPAVVSSPDHIAVIRPDQDLQRLTRDQFANLIIAQAGAKNFDRGRLADVDGWRSTGYRTVEFFVNDGDVGLRSFNYPDFSIRHRNFAAFIDRNDTSPLFRLDSSFRVRPGLADPSAVSFESVNYPGYYLRHSNYRLILSRNDGSTPFKQEATFYARQGLGSAVGVSFESYNRRGYFLRHRNCQIWLDRFEESRLFREDATFLPIV